MDEVKEHAVVGTWRLRSWETSINGGEVSYPLGRNVIGYRTYTNDGYMNVVVSKAKRDRFELDDIFGASKEEKQSVSDTFVAYAGRYTVGEGAITHQIELCSFLNRIGVQERLFERKGNQLILSTRPMTVRGRLQTNRLIWEQA